MKSAKELTIIAPLGAPRRRQRLAKMIPFYQKAGFFVRFRGWERVKGEAKQWRWLGQAIEESSILVGGGHNNSKARSMYPIWMCRVFFLLLTSRRAGLYHCLGWETAFPAVLAGILRGHDIIFDDADRFSMVVGSGGSLGRLLMMLEDWTASRSVMHIIPSFSRYPKRSKSDFVLPNMPTRVDIDIARSLPLEKSGAFVVYANGWLPRTRGAHIILEAFKRFSQGKASVRLIIVGFMPDDVRVEFANLEGLSYHGEVTQSEALSLYQLCDLLVTFYDPAVPINRYAESNKWGDAVCFKVPFVVNTEVETARHYVERGCAFAVPYGDIPALVDLFNRLYADPELLDRARARLAEINSDFQDFDQRMRQAVERILVLRDKPR